VNVDAYAYLLWKVFACRKNESVRLSTTPSSIDGTDKEKTKTIAEMGQILGHRGFFFCGTKLQKSKNWAYVDVPEEKKLDCMTSGQMQKTLSGVDTSRANRSRSPELEQDHQLVVAKKHISAKRKGTKRKELCALCTQMSKRS
jgi:hypothetical protein